MEMKLMNFVNGQFQQQAGAEFVPVINPATGEELAQVQRSTAADVDEAVKAAKAAQKKWALVPAPKRADYLYEIGRLMKERKEHLATVLTKEMGKVIEEGRGEVQEGIDMAFYMAGEGRRMFSETSSALPHFQFDTHRTASIYIKSRKWKFP